MDLAFNVRHHRFSFRSFPPDLVFVATTGFIPTSSLGSRAVCAPPLRFCSQFDSSVPQRFPGLDSFFSLLTDFALATASRSGVSPSAGRGCCRPSFIFSFLFLCHQDFVLPILVAAVVVLALKFFVSFLLAGLFIYCSRLSLLWLCAPVKNAKGVAFLESSSIWFQSFVLQGFGLSRAWLQSSLRPKFCRSHPGIIFCQADFYFSVSVGCHTV
jgi:hypothetical protein